MLISRTPMRISIGGGGTDLPSYYEKYGGFVISAAINKYIFISVNRMFTDDIFLKYSTFERVQDINEIQHPIMREALRMNGLGKSLEIVSVADIPAGTGLGSSGSFTVGLLKALHGIKQDYISAHELAEEACHIEMNLLGTASGKQDQYIAAFGGLSCFEFDTSGNVKASRLKISSDTMTHLSDHVLMFFTGYSRSSESILGDQKVRTSQGDSSMIDNLHFIRDLGMQIRESLEAGDPRRFGELMHRHWLHKRERSKGMSNPCIDRWYNVATSNGAVGGKLVGAGGGGFLLFYAANPKHLRAAMAREGLQEVRFAFDHDGSTLICRD